MAYTYLLENSFLQSLHFPEEHTNFIPIGKGAFFIKKKVNLSLKYQKMKYVYNTALQLLKIKSI